MDTFLRGTKKIFEQRLKEENDCRAKAEISCYLVLQKDMIVTDNPDMYDVDLLVESSGLNSNRYAVECEIKRGWSGPDFPWRTIQLPERKRKYLQQGLPVEYWVLNSECTHAIVIPGELLSKYEPVEVANKYVEKGEFFFQIPVSECLRINLYE